MLKKILLTALGLAVLIGVIAGVKIAQIKTMIAAGSSYVPPPEPVTTAVVTEQDWAPTLTAVGSLAAIQGVTVSAELDGNVARIAFRPGQAVTAGQLLVQQDIGEERAQLDSAKAAMDLARISLTRARRLLDSHTISQSEFDSAEGGYRQAAAAADEVRAVIAKKTIRAPFSGRLGLRLVDLGQTLKAGDPIVSLQALDPIFVDFSLPQQDLAQLALGQPVAVTSDVLPGRTAEGRLTAISPDVDSATRNVRVEATLENPGERLHPGMFVETAVVLPARRKVRVIPATAVLYAPYGDSVFVVERKQDEKTGRSYLAVRQQFVRLGETRGDFVAVLSGLAPGDTIVSTGAFKLRNGTPVTVDNALAPEAKLAPTPSDS